MEVLTCVNFSLSNVKRVIVISRPLDTHVNENGQKRNSIGVCKSKKKCVYRITGRRFKCGWINLCRQLISSHHPGLKIKLTRLLFKMIVQDVTSLDKFTFSKGWSSP